jgi:hypothetical protein
LSRPYSPLSDAAEQQLRDVCAELERRLRSGDPCRAEEFLEKFPNLADEREGLLDLLYTEYLTRLDLCQRDLAEEVYHRFPEWRESLQQQFECHDWLHGLVEGMPGTEEEALPDWTVPADGEEKAGGPEGYQLLEEIGRGGMGVVYQAWQTCLNRVVALKVVLAGAHAGSQELARFRREAEAVARLQHPNIIQIYEVGQSGGTPYLVLEFLDGGTLAERLAGGPLPFRQAAEWVRTLAWAMHHAHERGIVHCDLTPSNVLLTASDVPKVSDFGLAKLLAVGGTVQSCSRVFLGTPSYVSPEQIEARVADIGPPTDVYGLGGVLYEALVGRPAFRGETALETLHLVQTEEPAAPGQLRPGLPRDLEVICLKCLEKDPARRYPTAQALAEDLERFLANRPIKARPLGLFERGARWGRRRWTVAAPLLAAALLPCLLVFGMLVWEWRRAEAVWSEVSAQAAAEARDRERLSAAPTTTSTSTILHVTRGKVFLGEIILDKHDCVRHADRGIPKDVVLKTLVQYTCGDELSGSTLGRDGKSYGWQFITWDGE